MPLASNTLITDLKASLANTRHGWRVTSVMDDDPTTTQFMTGYVSLWSAYDDTTGLGLNSTFSIQVLAPAAAILHIGNTNFATVDTTLIATILTLARAFVTAAQAAAIVTLTS